MQNSSSEEPLLVRVAECLYRNQSSGSYFALVKRKGKQIKKTLKTTDRKLAERRLRDFRKKAEHLTATSSERKVPFKDLAARWAKIHNTRLKPSSADRNLRCIKELNKFFGSLPISSILPRQCEDWAADRSAGIAASTFNKDLLVLKAVLDYAQQDGLILDSPAKDLRRHKVIDKPILIPSHEEYGRLLTAIDELDGRASHARNLIELLALSGMRLGEATRIIWREVDLANQRFTVSGGDVGTKNGEVRKVPLFPSLERLLKSLKESDDANATSTIIPIGTTRTALETACKQAKLPHFTHHTFRHFFVSNAIEAGVDFKTVADWIGHKDGGMLVSQRYGHLRPSHSIKMAELMD
jgi:integrase